MVTLALPTALPSASLIVPETLPPTLAHASAADITPAMQRALPILYAQQRIADVNISLFSRDLVRADTCEGS
jgi:hypothetical protein